MAEGDFNFPSFYICVIFLFCFPPLLLTQPRILLKLVDEKIRLSWFRFKFDENLKALVISLFAFSEMTGESEGKSCFLYSPNVI